MIREIPQTPTVKFKLEFPYSNLRMKMPAGFFILAQKHIQNSNNILFAPPEKFCRKSQYSRIN